MVDLLHLEKRNMGKKAEIHSILPPNLSGVRAERNIV